MSFQKFETHSYCVGRRDISVTTNNYGAMISKCSKVIISDCSISDRKKSMTVNDNTIQAEGSGSFLQKV